MGPIDGEIIRIGQLELQFLATGAENGGHATVFTVTVQPGAKVPGAHHHLDVDEVVYGLEGVTTYTLGGTPYELRAGDAVWAPRGIEHHFMNRGDVPAKFLSVLTPGLIGPAYFREVAEVMAAGGPPDLAKIGAVMKKHGLVPAPSMQLPT